MHGQRNNTFYNMLGWCLGANNGFFHAVVAFVGWVVFAFALQVATSFSFQPWPVHLRLGPKKYDLTLLVFKFPLGLAPFLVGWLYIAVWMFAPETSVGQLLGIPPMSAVSALRLSASPAHVSHGAVAHLALQPQLLHAA